MFRLMREAEYPSPIIDQSAPVATHTIWYYGLTLLSLCPEVWSNPIRGATGVRSTRVLSSKRMVGSEKKTLLCSQQFAVNSGFGVSMFK